MEMGDIWTKFVLQGSQGFHVGESMFDFRQGFLLGPDLAQYDFMTP
jgi:hypothetical protein